MQHDQTQQDQLMESAVADTRENLEQLTLDEKHHSKNSKDFVAPPGGPVTVKAAVVGDLGSIVSSLSKKSMCIDNGVMKPIYLFLAEQLSRMENIEPTLIIDIFMRLEQFLRTTHKVPLVTDIESWKVELGSKCGDNVQIRVAIPVFTWNKGAFEFIPDALKQL